MRSHQPGGTGGGCGAPRGQSIAAVQCQARPRPRRWARRPEVGCPYIAGARRPSVLHDKVPVQTYIFGQSTRLFDWLCTFHVRKRRATSKMVGRDLGKASAAIWNISADWDESMKIGSGHDQSPRRRTDAVSKYILVKNVTMKSHWYQNVYLICIRLCTCLVSER